MKLKKESFLLKVVGYIFIMAIANAAILHIFHYRYQDIGFGHLLFFFEVILSFYALWVYKKETPIVRLKDFRITPWFIPSLLVMGAILIIHLLANPFAKDAMTILKLMMTTILVGFSEEVLFRGFMLNNLIKRYSAIKAILISSVAFSLLHAVNILGVSHSMLYQGNW
ncbi:CPBP family intramembrane metalloprotease [Streptococcus didelphis]|uniref:CPBP family intramembrane metalloprotease n=2 Tax=Streptococcus didelphis TaxID=102886 RepID=A0ABY9LIU7_9STRE|nr:CPBP family intramembrane glutamic endopeptidase [Streptococcus didelphis]WMB28767.1 CPBP family intramembrane metalloprotease [Streptococcus didelphis]